MRQPAGTISIRGMTTTAPLEIIRFAASNRFCVELDYTDEQGKRDVQIIEPYSLRRTQAGDVILYAVGNDTQAQCIYRIDRIRRARATHQTFSPQYAIELTPNRSDCRSAQSLLKLQPLVGEIGWHTLW